MINFLISSLFIIVFSASIYGWGSLVSHICYRETKIGFAYNCTLGIALLVVIGGLLNISQLAYPSALHLLLYGGVIITFITVLRHYRAPLKTNAHVQTERNSKAGTDKSTQPGRGFLAMDSLLFACVILIPFVFLIYNLMPANSFNLHDDFQVYFVRPFRMLQTGTVGGDPFDVLGLDSLGSLSFIQAFTLLWLDAGYLNAFDAVVCFLLCIGLIIEIGKELKVKTILILLAVILFFLINSQYANISSLYSGSLMLLGIAYSYLIIYRHGSLSREPLKIVILSSLPLSIIFVSLLSFKMTYFFIIALFFITNILLATVFNPDKKKTLQLNIFCALFIVLLIAPWVLIHLQKYLTLAHNFLGDLSITGELSAGHFNNQIKSIVTAGNSKVISELLSTSELYYGNTYRDYLLAILASFLTGFFAAIYVWRNKTYMLVPLIALLLLGAFNYFLLSRLFPARLVIRYSCPMIFAIMPLAVLLIGNIMRPEMYFWRDYFASKVIVTVCSVLLIWQMVVGGMFGTTFGERVKRVLNYRTHLSFPAAIIDDYRSYSLLILSDAGKQKMLSHQNEVKPGLKILGWLSAPFWLDFSRNKLYIVNHAGLHNDWLNLPLSGGSNAMLEYYKQMGIDNFIWEYRGKGMKYGSTSSVLAETMSPVAQKSRIFFDDGGTLVFNIRQQ